jgi:alpha-tubulin suppressor-like RCC1 family protein
VTTDGTLVVSGSSLHGKLGIEGLNKTNINKFLVVPIFMKKKVRQVACGDYHTLCLLEDCTVFQFGGSQLKDKKDKNKSPQSHPPSNPHAPQPIQTLYGKDII